MSLTLSIIMPAIVIGVIAGVVDLFFMIKDETGQASTIIGHGIGAFIPLIILSAVSMHLEWLMNMNWAVGTILANEIVMRIAFVLVTAGIIMGKSRAFKGARGTGMHESFIHTLIIGIIIGAAPYLWMLIGPMLPAWMSGST